MQRGFLFDSDQISLQMQNNELFSERELHFDIFNFSQIGLIVAPLAPLLPNISMARMELLPSREFGGL